MFSPGGEIRIHLDSRLKHAGMTDFGLATILYLTQQKIAENKAISLIGSD
jgi:hypothetical protein